MTKILGIVGASGHGKVIADMAELLGYTVFFYDDAYPNKRQIEHWLIRGNTLDLIKLKNIEVVVAIGDNNIRKQKVQLLQEKNFTIVTLIHPTAVISKYAAIANGSVVLPGAVINAFAKVGAGCIINTAAVVEHDCIIGDFSHICPNVSLAGGVTIGSKVWVGIGSQVKQLITIGDNSLVGLGSTVIKNIPGNVIAYGSPAVVI